MNNTPVYPQYSYMFPKKAKHRALRIRQALYIRNTVSIENPGILPVFSIVTDGTQRAGRHNSESGVRIRQARV